MMSNILYIAWMKTMEYNEKQNNVRAFISHVKYEKYLVKNEIANWNNSMYYII